MPPGSFFDGIVTLSPRQSLFKTALVAHLQIGGAITLDVRASFAQWVPSVITARFGSVSALLN